MLLKLGMTVRPFAIVFAVDSLIVTDVRPIAVVVVSTIFENEGFQIDGGVQEGRYGYICSISFSQGRRH